jgi:hypothetical protein
LRDQVLKQRQPQPQRVDVPGGDTKALGHAGSIARMRRGGKGRMRGDYLDLL